jgi:hypothetical protein
MPKDDNPFFKNNIYMCSLEVFMILTDMNNRTADKKEEYQRSNIYTCIRNMHTHRRQNFKRAATV